MSSPRLVDLSRARSSPEVDVIAGRDKGEYWRKEFDIDGLDQSPDVVRVHVPDDLAILSLSFFLNLFGKSVRTFGREGFRAKYQFQANEEIEIQIEKGIAQALKRKVGIPETR